MQNISFNTYYRYDALVAQLTTLAAAYPGLMRLDSIGKSHEGRDLWLATVSHFSTGQPHEKPAFWVDGNLHATELAGSMACLYLIHTLLSRYGHDQEITRCLDSRTFYICPRVNPDGAELALADRPKFLRSSARPYPYPEDPRGGLITEDIDGDGRILSMRIPDPDGPWKVYPQDPRLMVPRDPAESGGNYYRLLPEGRLEEYDGALIHLQRPKAGLDLNRNFPIEWRSEGQQAGAGPYPASEPEVRALVDFIASHNNICGGVAFHTYSGVLLRPLSYQADDSLPPEDLWTYHRIGERGTQLSGYPAASAYHEFRYHPKEVITGAMDDWLYEQRGVFAWTVELWSPQRQAGIKEHKYIDWYRLHPLADDLKLLQWNDTVLGGQGYVPWYPYQHPQLGKVELGGWNPLYTFLNPPPALLEQEIKPLAEWLVWHNLISPRLELHEFTAERLGDQHYRLRLVVRNSGWLPSYISKKALEKKMLRGVMADLTLPAAARLIQGELRQVGPQLEGRAHKPNSSFAWAGLVADPTDERAKFEWVIAAPPGSTLAVCARHDRAGVVRAQVTLT